MTLDGGNEKETIRIFISVGLTPSPRLRVALPRARGAGVAAGIRAKPAVQHREKASLSDGAHDLHKASQLRLELHIGDGVTVHQTPQRKGRRIAVVKAGLDRRRALHPQGGQPFCLVESIDTARVAKMLERARDKRPEKSAIFADLALDLFAVLEQPIVVVRVELDVEARFRQLAELTLVDQPEELLPLD